MRGTQQRFAFELPPAAEKQGTGPASAPEVRPSTGADRLAETVDRIASTQQFLAAAVVEIRKNLPLQRRPLSARTRALHVRVIATRRNGLCPCCQETPVCTTEGKLPGAEFDHWYSRHQNRPAETWLVCAECNRQLRIPDFKAAARSAFEAYQQALRPFLVGRQAAMFRGEATRKSA